MRSFESLYKGSPRRLNLIPKMGFIEKFSYLIANDGKFNKFFKVLLNEEQNKIWIDIRLFYEDKPTKYGVTLTQDEYHYLAKYLKAIHLNESIGMAPYYNMYRRLDVYKIGYEMVYVIELTKVVLGISKRIKVTPQDIARLYELDQSQDTVYKEYCDNITENGGL